MERDPTFPTDKLNTQKCKYIKDPINVGATAQISW